MPLHSGPMRFLVDLAYLVALVATAPVWGVQLARGRRHVDWRGRFGFGDRAPAPRGPRLALHGVSVGEINAIRTLVSELESGAEPPELVISATTDTGFARARQLFGDRHRVVRQPFDFSGCVRRFLDRIQPTVFASVELEVWPNLTRACAARGVPFVVVNGRVSDRSARRYARVSALVRPSFARVTRVLAQDETYARRFVALGVAPERVEVGGTMKWDGARVVDDDVDPADVVDGAIALAKALGVDRARPLVVAGSTAPEEHALLHGAVPPGVQLLCAPRRPEWFDAAEAALPGCIRRTRTDGGRGGDRFLLDTIGELGAAYALATVVVIGRSFGRMHGSDMMEPAAMGRAIVVGPAVADFRATMDALLEGGGIVQCAAEDLPRVLAELLADTDRRRDLGGRARAVVRARRGASALAADALRAAAGRGPRHEPAGFA